MKKLACCADQYHQLPEEPLLKLMVRVTNLGAMSLVLKAAEGRSIFGLVQSPQVTTEQSHMVVHDPDTQKVTSEVTASLSDWI